MSCVSSSGKVYNMSEVWQEDSCTNCTCQGGRIQCHVSMCKHQHTCENPKHYPGECCPRCEIDNIDNEKFVNGHNVDEAIETSQNPAAPMDKDSCPFRACHRDISCPKGFRLDKAGCPTCECQKCQSLLGCKLACTHGLKVDKFGCPVCECSRGEDEVDQVNNLLSLSSSVSRAAAAALFCAVDSDGVRRMDGEEWSDHCRRCVCRNGKEMCSLITCQVPKCEHPIFYPGDCCPRCPGWSCFWYFPLHPYKFSCESPPYHHFVLAIKDHCAFCQRLEIPQLPIIMHYTKTSVSFSLVNVSVCLSTDGVERIEGETWTLSSCLTCTCHSGQVFCAAPDCPPTPCSSPKLVDCCLQCPSSNNDNTDDDDDGSKDHSVTSLKTSNKNCLSDDSIKTYLDGDTWKVGSCQSCRCEDGQIQCFSAGKCPALECARPILAKNQCCPICLVYKP
ncbi:Cysteine-rich motor neuron 1 protein [Orchesella cincta]|uniref:Cysteine-rich motor neuron 1 protein n=1 Tax=Orchesella cincta TaxID=48709 RepID=A0A1D2NL21_ORCCI|nr:Cysteine-rich motor neuron 1 protein [Orchesella cincta]